MKNLISLAVLAGLVFATGCASGASYYYFSTPPSQKLPAKPEGDKYYSYSAGRTTTETKVVQGWGMDWQGNVSGQAMAPRPPVHESYSSWEGRNGFVKQSYSGGTGSVREYMNQNGEIIRETTVTQYESSSRTPNYTTTHPTNVREQKIRPGGVSRFLRAIGGNK